MFGAPRETDHVHTNFEITLHGSVQCQYCIGLISVWRLVYTLCFCDSAGRTNSGCCNRR